MLHPSASTLACCALFISALASTAPLRAEESSNTATDYKLTLSYYGAADDNNANDINLRIHNAAHTAWVGRYADSAGFIQTRAGYENRQDFGWARLTTTLELGTHGYAGIAASTELGKQTYAILGIDRTNLHPFYNLGFDPSDAIVAGIGTRAVANTEIDVYQIRENRADTKRRSTHAYWRYHIDELWRLTVDAAHKSGIDDAGDQVSGNSLSITLDYGNYFARVAHDPYANFGNSSLNRFSLGLRF